MDTVERSPQKGAKQEVQDDDVPIGGVGVRANLVVGSLDVSRKVERHGEDVGHVGL